MDFRDLDILLLVGPGGDEVHLFVVQPADVYIKAPAQQLEVRRGNAVSQIHMDRFSVFWRTKRVLYHQLAIGIMILLKPRRTLLCVRLLSTFSVGPCSDQSAGEA